MTASSPHAVRSDAGRAVVIGAGPAGLMAAETLADRGVAVTIYDRMPSAGRKFLMAGRGGLNLTHSEPFEALLARYGAAAAALRPAITQFSPVALRAWSEALGEPTFVGSSGRVFPRSLKASPLLRAWLRRLAGRGVRLVLRHRWIGWTATGDLALEGPGGGVTDRAPVTVLALGGASWPRLGSDATWVEVLRGQGVEVTRLRPANCGFLVAWSDGFRARFAGTPLKGVALAAGAQSTRGEAMITRDGIEGGGVYALAAALRDEIERSGAATLSIALRPDLAPSVLRDRLAAPRGKQSFATFLRKRLNLAPVAVALLREAAGGRDPGRLSAEDLAALINALPIRLDGTAPLERAISTAGGIALGEVDAQFMIRRLPGVFVAGEMLDWEAPTGGYLLQASLATGAAAGRGALAWLGQTG